MLRNSDGDEPISPSPLTSPSFDKQGGTTVGGERGRNDMICAAAWNMRDDRRGT